MQLSDLTVGVEWYAVLHPLPASASPTAPPPHSHSANVRFVNTHQRVWWSRRPFQSIHW